MRRCIDEAVPALGRVARCVLGPCRVIHAIGCGPLIRGAHCPRPHPSLLLCQPCRPRAGAHLRPGPAQWAGQLTAYAPATIERLATWAFTLLVGIDTASIDPADSKTLDSHQVIRRRGLRVLENLVLDDVPEGDYELIALPLKLTTADASPCGRCSLAAWLTIASTHFKRFRPLALIQQAPAAIKMKNINMTITLQDCRKPRRPRPLRSLRDHFALPPA